MSRTSLLAGVAWAALSAAVPARAQWIVSDPPAEVNTLETAINMVTQVGQGTKEIENQVTQIGQLTSTVNAIAHGNIFAITSLAPELGDLGLLDPLDLSASDINEAIVGVQQAQGAIGGLTNTYRQMTQVFTPTGGDFRATFLPQQALGLASQLAMASQMASASQQRMQALPKIMTAAAAAPDIKASMDANVRLTGELAQQSAQTNQTLSNMWTSQATAQMQTAQQEQLWRCSAEQMYLDEAAAAQDAANGIVGSSAHGKALNCGSQMAQAGGASVIPASTTASAASIMSGISPSISSPGDDGGVLASMEAQSWGQQAAQNAQSLGVNPAALAATCVVESGCTNVASAAGGTASGPWQMINSTYSSDIATATAQNPSLASQVTDKSDPATESIAASQELLTAAQSLQAGGIANPTVLDTRGYYQFGAGYGAQIAAAPNSANLSQIVTTLTPAQLAANGITSTTTVGQWRASVTNKLGAGASQAVLLPGTSSAT